MRLDALLRAHGFMKIERPPELWEADSDDARFLPLLGEINARLLDAGARYAYIRRLTPKGSITVFLSRLRT